MTIFARPSEWTRAAAAGRPDAGAAVGRGQRYFAFLSYSHRDEARAEWLHEQLEKFRVPSNLVGRLTEHGPIPRRLTPVFRDVHELAASDDLGSEIREAIGGSRFLIVLCSPASVASRWTNAEIEEFKRVRPEGCILAAIVDGEPFASDVPGREEEECFPPALRYQYDKRGRRTDKREEPLAADLRGSGEARRLGFLKLVAGMLGLGLDELVRRETLRRQRRLGLIAAASLAGMILASGLAVTAIQARDAARDQRREAEGLVEFMLGDLRTKLEPIGRLDALDGVGRRVLAYYRKQDMAELPDEALLQRSRALTLMGEVAQLRGQIDAALQLYGEAMAGTAEAVRRDPNDPQRLFDHAQNVFWMGEIARHRGDMRLAESAMRTYERLAARMVSIEPDNMRWRMEAQYADANLGIILLEQRRFAEAVRQFGQALETIEALATADRQNRGYQQSFAEALAWLADAEAGAGRIGNALEYRRRHVALLRRMLLDRGEDVEFRQELIQAHRALGRLLAMRGETDAALQELAAAVRHSELLIPRDPSNRLWLADGGSARLTFAQTLLPAGRRQEAGAHTDVACRTFANLLQRDRTVAQWRGGWRGCLRMRALLALDGRDYGTATRLVDQALAAASAEHSSDRVADLYEVAGTRRLAGDIRRAAGDMQGARQQWHAGLDALPKNAREKPAEMAERAALLQRLNMTSEVKPLIERLNNIGYRRIG